MGDGCTSVLHCEFADDDKIFESEPDANMILCNYGETMKTKYEIRKIEGEDNAWECQAQDIDVAITLDHGEYIVDYFDSSIEDNDKAYISTKVFLEWQQVQNFINELE